MQEKKTIDCKKKKCVYGTQNYFEKPKINRM